MSCPWSFEEHTGGLKTPFISIFVAAQGASKISLKERICKVVGYVAAERHPLPATEAVKRLKGSHPVTAHRFAAEDMSRLLAPHLSMSETIEKCLFGGLNN